MIENTSPELVSRPVSSLFDTIPHTGSAIWGLGKTGLVYREDLDLGLPSRRSRAQDLPLWFADLSLDNRRLVPALPDITSHGMA